VATCEPLTSGCEFGHSRRGHYPSMRVSDQRKPFIGPGRHLTPLMKQSMDITKGFRSAIYGCKSTGREFRLTLWGLRSRGR
jgi:hypothetical protein